MVTLFISLVITLSVLFIGLFVGTTVLHELE